MRRASACARNLHPSPSRKRHAGYKIYILEETYCLPKWRGVLFTIGRDIFKTTLLFTKTQFNNLSTYRESYRLSDEEL